MRQRTICKLGLGLPFAARGLVGRPAPPLLAHCATSSSSGLVHGAGLPSLEQQLLQALQRLLAVSSTGAVVQVHALMIPIAHVGAAAGPQRAKVAQRLHQRQQLLLLLARLLPGCHAVGVCLWQARALQQQGQADDGAAAADAWALNTEGEGTADWQLQALHEVILHIIICLVWQLAVAVLLQPLQHRVKLMA